MEILVIGAGPSGMMAAISAKEHHPHATVRLLDGNARLGTKMRLSGGGRCNVTANVNNDVIIQNIPKNGKFLYSSLENFGPKEIIAYFNEKNCPLKEEDHQRMFPVSNRSHDIVDAMHRHLDELGVNIHLQRRVEAIDFTNKLVKTSQNTMKYDGLIIASGGKTLPGSGSDGSMFQIIETLGHTITKLTPAEVPLVSNDQVIQDKSLQGLSFNDVEVSIYHKAKVKHTLTHDLLFTHFGLSGPAALRSSFYILKIMEKEKPVKLTLDFIPTVSFEDLHDILEKNEVNDLYHLFQLPKRLIDYLDEQANNNHELGQWLKKFPISVYETRGFSHAFLTNGGVHVKEVDPKTMKSKQDTSVSFCGEVLDFNAFTGGYNITAALSSGYTAGKYVL
ncbi:aminoacetone oxidase family FAD-binding enzyme [Erysipelothrix urinaevulpis]|uniref:aminoacetone oxidase family FAD-binding enzyme n=1 Tax=Erysipelothrix urinaevulpis TaxID=2683717 RepID=UPI001F3E6CB5|nr:aminoacetone oxidase family FAD-binding enzyme [Erysipelothrix urinaevulpis]